MRAQIVRIGNSRGIRIPRALLEQSGLSGAVELQVRRGALLVRRLPAARAGWEAAFRRMATEGHDALLDPGVRRETPWERAEWRW